MLCCQEVSEVEFGEGAMLSGSVRGGVWGRCRPCCQEVSEVEFGEGAGDVVKTGVRGGMKVPAMLSGSVRGGVW